jgi:hypothetical protein
MRRGLGYVGRWVVGGVALVGCGGSTASGGTPDATADSSVVVDAGADHRVDARAVDARQGGGDAEGGSAPLDATRPSPDAKGIADAARDSTGSATGDAGARDAGEPKDAAGPSDAAPKPESGPPDANDAGAGQGCTFDTRAFGVVLPGSSDRIELITAYGKYWSFDATTGTPLAGNGATLDSVARYASGPCAGQPAGACKFDTRTFVVLGGDLLESITAYGKYWNFDVTTGYTALSGNGATLDSVARYASGPCTGQPAGMCTFDTRTFVVLPGSSDLVESITANGAYWNFDITTGSSPYPENGSVLDSVSWLATGPCAGRPAGTCQLDTRAFGTTPSSGSDVIESDTAYGRYWNFDTTTGSTPLAGNGSTLESVPRYASGPCMH